MPPKKLYSSKHLLRLWRTGYGREQPMKKKTIRISQISLPPGHSSEQVLEKACRIAGVKKENILHFEIIKQSIDARKKQELTYIYSANLTIPSGMRYQKNRHVTEISPVVYHPVCCGKEPLKDPVAVIGTGPAGLFCAYLLAVRGYCPVVFERGKSVDERTADVERFWEGAELLPESNVQFGEGGAGTFSDGKLNTLVKDKYGRNRFVLETFVKFGAPEEILYVNKPHIGTDLLRTVVKNMRNEIIRAGGQVFFSSKVTGFQTEQGRISSLEINHTRQFPVSAAVFAIGHSARDTFAMLYHSGVPMQPKAFAAGMRVEHPQSMINRNQYADFAGLPKLPPASYKLTHQSSGGRSVYSFCMCPGGYVVNASSEAGMLAVNGMSYHDRDSRNANSAIIVSVSPADFDNPDDPLSGLAFQRRLEQNAYEAGRGAIPQQLFGDFENNTTSTGYGAFSSCAKGKTAFANLRQIFPETLNEAFLEGMHAFARVIPEFDRQDAILSGVESRTSSPVRIPRDDSLESTVAGLYPCGEGAGYAGGITSAAMDGLKTAEAIMKKYKPANQS